jgi:hypothetical protein
MSAPAYKCPPGTASSIVANTPTTVWGVKAHANSGLLLRKVRYSIKGADASQVPWTVDLCYSTWATNSPGTNSTSITPVQTSGRVLTAGFTAARTWTAEPTTLTVIEQEFITPDAGRLWYDFPLGDELDCALAEGFALRITSPAGAATVTALATGEVSRC